MKKLSSQSLIGQQGVNLVERIVLEMKYAWRPTPGFDVGIDGEEEGLEKQTMSDKDNQPELFGL